MTVGIYARVSTAGNGQSPEMQLRELREYVERRGWTLAGEYVDEGISGAGLATGTKPAGGGRAPSQIRLCPGLEIRPVRSQRLAPAARPGFAASFDLR